MKRKCKHFWLPYQWMPVEGLENNTGTPLRPINQRVIVVYCAKCLGIKKVV